ncbi:hypothetical protein LNAOJCKE_5185 [Methylorubrum aminovorans]|uniref:Phage gp6-like head-tail connector protein n=1 Tax=Methylorubrum aminovorans TaxID=269069 RepID=A0ABQ4UPE2_9HYPH|nr:head-tail connector protein [Methylorubrum aminovorans]GJE67950.1 hypothetical protein LNAOJCKE_5185 [Methylorubrum aminovorans]GMA76347.1 hypothetical protein GCM10025880_27640 [Methylorubrum aminovorans]
MSVTVITPPEAIVSLEEAKRHLRVEHDSDDAYIEGLIGVATSAIDGPMGWLGRALGEQTLETEVSACTWRDDPSLPYPPLLAVESETPSQDGRKVRIRYRAGYPVVGEGDNRRSTVPAPIRQAVLLMVGDLYANRENGGPSASAAAVSMPVTADRLLQPFRVYFG